MADRPGNASVSLSPELHRLNYSPRTTHILGRTMLMQNSLTMPVSESIGISSLFSQENKNSSSQQYPNSSPSSVKSPKDKRRSTAVNAVVCVVRGIFRVASATALAPIERVYLLMQSQNEMIKCGRLSSPYKGIKDCFLRTIKHEGVISLWRGNSVNVIQIFGTQAISFALLQRFPPKQNMVKKKTDESRTWLLRFVYSSGLLLVFYPLDYARIRLANDVKVSGVMHFSLDASGKKLGNYDAGNRQFSGVFDVYKKTIQRDGIFGVYRGYTLTCVGFTACQLTVDWIKARYSSQKLKQQESRTLLAKVMPLFMLLGVRGAYYPYLSVSRRMMMTSASREVTKYKSAMDAFCQIVKHEGVSSLYKGVTPYMIHHVIKDLAVFSMTYLARSALGKSISKSK